MNKDLLTNPKLAKLVACVTGDGHLQINNWRYLTSFFSKHLEEIEEFEKISKELFGVIPKRYEDRRKTWCGSGLRYQSFIISKQVAIFLRKIGVPVGNKTNSSFVVPDWVFNGSDNVKRSYLRALYDNEGTIYFNKSKERIRWRIDFKMAKNQEILDHGIYFFEQLRKMLKEFGVKSSPVNCSKLNVRKDGSTSMVLKFSIEYSSFGNFLKHIGFDHNEKHKKLLFALSVRGQTAKICSENLD